MVRTRSSARLASKAAADTAPPEPEDSSEPSYRALEKLEELEKQLRHKRTKSKRGASSASKTHAPAPQTSADMRLPMFPGYHNPGMPNMPQILPYPNPYSPGIIQSPGRMMDPHYLHMQIWGGSSGRSKSQVNNYPIHPDVKFKKLPFYQMISEVIKPSTLPNVNLDNKLQDFKFNLTPQEIDGYANEPDVVSLQLRFCLLETSCEQDDIFPPNLTVKVNGKFCQLPMPIPTNKILVEPKRPPGPVNITPLVRMSPVYSNVVSLSWKNDFGRQYVFCLSLVKKLTSTHLLNHLKSKGTKNPDFTRSLIKEKLREDLDCEIATTSLRVSLVCPLGKMRMICPCRPSTCLHLQCFDASLFLQMNERKSSWLCPVCDKPALYDSLVVDGYFQDVLNSSRLEKDCTEIQLHKDGSWSVHLKEIVPEAVLNETSNANIEIINDDVDVIPVSDGSESSSGTSAKKRSASAAFASTYAEDVVNLISDDSDDDLPLKKKASKPSSSDSTPIEVACDSAFISADSTTALDYNEFRDQFIRGSFNNRNRSTSVITLDSPSPPGNRDSPALETIDSPSIPENAQSPMEALDSPSPSANVHSPPETVDSPSQFKTPTGQSPETVDSSHPRDVVSPNPHDVVSHNPHDVVSPNPHDVVSPNRHDVVSPNPHVSPIPHDVVSPNPRDVVSLTLENIDSPASERDFCSPSKVENKIEPETVFCPGIDALNSPISPAAFSPEPDAFDNLAQEALDRLASDHSLKDFSNKTTDQPLADSLPSSDAHKNPFEEEPCGFLSAESSEENDSGELESTIRYGK